LALMVWPIGTPSALAGIAGDPKRGAYLARMSGCIACHTNSASGSAPLAGGVELSTGFGTFYSPNLTTDEAHGMGAWSLADFDKAVRQGISPEGEPYYPAFPYGFYAKLTDQDIADLWAAFQTVPPVAEPSKEQDLTFPFSFRSGMKLWRALFWEQEAFQPERNRSDGWNRGKYIVEGPGHCGACHTPRNLLGARKAGFDFQGAEGLPGGGKSPPITAARLKKKGWTIADLKYALKTGVLPDGDAFGGSMGEVVRDGTRFLSDEDLTAIATYLLDTEKPNAEK
jgi:mono/diheme cytochrome c family protein